MYKLLTIFSFFLATFSGFSLDIGKTFVMIKPHAVENKDSSEIVKMINGAGFKILKKKRLKMAKGKFDALYGIHREKGFFNDLKNSILEKKVIAIVLEGHDVVRRFREFAGNTDPKLAENGTIRKKFGVDKTRNAIHSSDSVESAEKEISIFFPEK